jgi:hypothetical protein
MCFRKNGLMAAYYEALGRTEDETGQEMDGVGDTNEVET